MTQDIKQKIWIKCKKELLESSKSPQIDSKTIGGQVLTLPSFQDSDNWNLFFERLQLYFKFNNIQSDRQVPVLLTCISESVYLELKKLCKPDSPNKKTIKQLVSILSKRYSGNRVWKRRIEFFQSKQCGTESVSEWMTRLQELAEECQFGESTDENIKNKFLSGLRQGPVLDRLCDEETNVTSQHLLTVALAIEKLDGDNSCTDLKNSPLVPPLKKLADITNSPVRRSPRNILLNRYDEGYWTGAFSISSAYQSTTNYYRHIGAGGYGDRPDKRGVKRPHNGDEDDDSNAPTCLCGLPSRKFTVRREGPNQGRDFYVCPKDQDKCNLYVWADETHVNIVCRCDIPAKKFTARKEGPNQGRHFYACSKMHGAPDRCQFFIWADEAERGTGDSATGRGSSNNFSRSSNTKGASSAKKSKSTKSKTPSKFRATGSEKPKTLRKCGVCGQTGHNRKNCPNNE